MTLIMWTVYDHPRDCPDNFVARKWIVSASIGIVPTPEVIMSRSLDEVRRAMENLGLTCLVRSPEDDPKIVESWV